MQKMIRSFETARGDIVLRSGNMADAPQYRDLRLSALQDAPTAFSADYQTNLTFPMSFWEGRLVSDDISVIFFAEHNSKLIGMTGIRIGETPKTKHGAYVWGVYVRSEWRGLHIAEQLIDICLEWGKQRDVVIAKLGVMANNESAIRCYKRMGFTIYGTEPRALFHDGQYYDEYLMSRALS
jgi:ribosomal protein S18 acetylase RimI-like enzyme